MEAAIFPLLLIVEPSKEQPNMDFYKKKKKKKKNSEKRKNSVTVEGKI